MSKEIDRTHLTQLRKIEEERFLANHKKSSDAFVDSQKVMHEGVPMSWMAKWPGAHPVFVKEAKGARFTDIDGHTYVDFCLGDTGSMTGHSPDATVAAVREQVGKGIKEFKEGVKEDDTDSKDDTKTDS